MHAVKLCIITSKFRVSLSKYHQSLGVVSKERWYQRPEADNCAGSSRYAHGLTTSCEVPVMISRLHAQYSKPDSLVRVAFWHLPCWLRHVAGAEHIDVFNYESNG
jgi:hypothetical protein